MVSVKWYYQIQTSGPYAPVSHVKWLIREYCFRFSHNLNTIEMICVHVFLDCAQGQLRLCKLANVIVIFFATLRSSPDNIFHENGCNLPWNSLKLMKLQWTCDVLFSGEQRPRSALLSLPSIEQFSFDQLRWTHPSSTGTDQRFTKRPKEGFIPVLHTQVFWALMISSLWDH